LDSNLLPVTVDVDMDGQVASESTQTFLRINRAYGIASGTGEINAGDISVSIGGDVQAFIETGEGQTHQTNYTVPAGFTLIITSFVTGTGRMTGSTDCQIAGQIKLYDQPHWRNISDLYLWNGAIHTGPQDTVTLVPEKTEIRQQITSTSTTQVYGIFAGYLVENRYL
jgi:hypothetical protein